MQAVSLSFFNIIDAQAFCHPVAAGTKSAKRSAEKLLLLDILFNICIDTDAL
jgi:hypothetical protein